MKSIIFSYPQNVNIESTYTVRGSSPAIHISSRRFFFFYNSSSVYHIPALTHASRHRFRTGIYIYIYIYITRCNSLRITAIYTRALKRQSARSRHNESRNHNILAADARYRLCKEKRRKEIEEWECIV